VEFQILGPISVRMNGSELALGGPKQRVLLAALLLAAGEIVSRDRLVEALWGAEAPPSAHRSLDSHVSRLRRVLGPDRLAREAPGYVLRLGTGELDLQCFEDLVRDARAVTASGNPAAAAQALHAAFSMWRGPALADILYEPFAALESQRLEEQRLAALEDRIDAELALGRGSELVAELQGTVRAHPWRERLAGQLMIALYRAGRQAEALSVYQDIRRRFAAELGLEPGAPLRELERRILQHDPGLDAPARIVREPRLPRRAVAGALALLGVVLLGGWIALGSSMTASPRDGPPRTNRLIGIRVNSGASTRVIKLPGSPAALAVAAQSLWAADPDGERVMRISPASGSVVDQIPAPGQPASLASGAASIWVASTLGGTIARIDANTDAVTQTVHLGGDDIAAIAFGARALWAADTTQRAVVEIDPRTGSVSRTVRLDLSPTSVAAGAGAVWVADYDTNLVEKLDPGSGRVIEAIHSGNGPAALAVGADGVWVANGLDSTVSKIDSQTGSLAATLAVGSGPSAVAVSGRSVWVASRYSGTVTRIQADTNRPIGTVFIGGHPFALAADGGELWVGARPSDTDHRGGTLRIVSTTPLPTVDPALAFTAEPFQFTRLAYDTLVTFEATPGSSGLRLVPDLGLAIPTPTDGGTSYTFQLRPGIRYSDGRLVHAADFRRAIERLFRTGSPGASYYQGL
jgi:DNA-binding SARP family transcriptional activator/DNA-binding beta-propeller fold protein YncE